MIFIFANPIISKLIFQILVKPIIRFFVDYELKKDQEILENLADKQMSLREMQLGRYDRVLGENRKRIDRLYRGEDRDTDTVGEFQKYNKERSLNP